MTHASEDGGEDGGEDGLVSSGTKSLELKLREKDELVADIRGEVGREDARFENS